MKHILKLFVLGSIVILSSCGKKKCNTCPDWGKANTETHQVEEA